MRRQTVQVTLRQVTLLITVIAIVAAGVRALQGVASERARRERAAVEAVGAVAIWRPRGGFAAWLFPVDARMQVVELSVPLCRPRQAGYHDFIRDSLKSLPDVEVVTVHGKLQHFSPQLNSFRIDLRRLKSEFPKVIFQLET